MDKERQDPHSAEALGLPKKTTITLLDGEVIKGTLIKVLHPRIVVKTDDGRTLKIFKHAIKYFED